MHSTYLNFYCFIDDYSFKIINNLPKNSHVIYRNYVDKIDEKKILKIKKICFQKKLKFYLSLNIKKAIQLNLDGSYIPSFDKSTKHNSFTFKNNFKLLGSCHNLKELRIKEGQKIDTIFISPIFKTKNYQRGLGVYKFKHLMNLTKKKVVCLGGVNQKNLKKLKMLGINNIAAISMFRNFK